VTFGLANSNNVKNPLILIKEIGTEDSKLVLRRIAVIIAVESTRQAAARPAVLRIPGGILQNRHVTAIPRRAVKEANFAHPKPSRLGGLDTLREFSPLNTDPAVLEPER
jgi:hypothetical protein